MPRSVTVSATIDAELAARLERLAETTSRSEASVVAEAVKHFVADEEAFIAAVEEGRAAARAGRLSEHAATVERIRRSLDPKVE